MLVVIGLLVLGPERLPRVASQMGRWIGRARRTANQLRYQIEREVALADIESAAKRKETDKPQAKAQSDSGVTDSGEENPGTPDSGITDTDTAGAAADVSSTGPLPPEETIAGVERPAEDAKQA